MEEDEELKGLIDEIYKEREYVSKHFGKGGNEMKLKERLKSPVFLGQVVLLVAECLKLFGLYEMPNDMINNIQDFITLGYQIFAGLNNPTDRNNF